MLPEADMTAGTVIEALGDYKAPLLTGDTNMDLLTFAEKNRDKYWNYFQVDPPEIYYGRMFPKFLDQVAAGGVWKPINNKVHIIREQNNYNMQIAKEVVETLPSSKFELATITDTNANQDESPPPLAGPLREAAARFSISLA